MVTIRDIARLSGYSVSSVSRVLNQHPHVSEEARQKIQAIIDDLDYKPNILAQELSAGKTYKLGLILPQSRHPYFRHLLDGLLDRAQETNYSLVILPSQYQASLEQDYLEQLRGGAFDGLIFSSRSIDLETINHYSKYGPIVVCEPTNQPKLSQIYLERSQSYLDIYTDLKKQKKQKIALLFTRADETSATYRESLSAFGQVFGEMAEQESFGGISTFEEGYQLGLTLYQQSFDAIFANSDDIAAGVAQAYEEKNVPLPLLIGQENQLSSRLLKITTIDHKAYELGQVAIDTLIKGQVDKKVFVSEVVWR